VHYLADGRGHWLGYQQVVVTADGTPTRPSIHGLHNPRTFGVRALENAVSLRGLLDAGPIGRALVVGTDHLGLEMAAALVHRGVHVVLVELTDRVLSPVDPPLVDLVSDEVRRHGIDRHVSPHPLAEVRSTTSRLSATIGGRPTTVDAVVVAARRIVRRGRSGDRARRRLAGRRLDAHGPCRTCLCSGRARAHSCLEGKSDVGNTDRDRDRCSVGDRCGGRGPARGRWAAGRRADLTACRVGGDGVSLITDVTDPAAVDHAVAEVHRTLTDRRW
jgi:hypothetical protein